MHFDSLVELRRKIVFAAAVRLHCLTALHCTECIPLGVSAKTISSFTQRVKSFKSLLQSIGFKSTIEKFMRKVLKQNTIENGVESFII